MYVDNLNFEELVEDDELMTMKMEIPVTKDLIIKLMLEFSMKIKFRVSAQIVIHGIGAGGDMQYV